MHMGDSVKRLHGAAKGTCTNCILLVALLIGCNMRNLIRCKLRNDGPLNIAQKVNELAPKITLFQMFKIWRFSLGI